MILKGSVKMSIKLQLHSGDNDMVEIYSIRNPKLPASFNREFMVLWGVVHIDFLEELGLTLEDIENHDYTLKAEA